MKKWIGAAVVLLFFVGLLAFLLPILGWQKQLDQESAEYEVLSSAVQLPQASEPPVVTPSEADSSVLNDLISSLDGYVLSEIFLHLPFLPARRALTLQPAKRRTATLPHG